MAERNDARIGILSGIVAAAMLVALAAMAFGAFG